MYIVLHVSNLLFFSDFNETWICWTDFLKIIKYKISWKFVQWEPSCFVRTDMTKLTVAFRNFVNAPKINALAGKLIYETTKPGKLNIRDKNLRARTHYILGNGKLPLLHIQAMQLPTPELREFSYHSPAHTVKCYNRNIRNAKYPFCNTFFTVYSNSYLIMWPTKHTIFRLKIR